MTKRFAPNRDAAYVMLRFIAAVDPATAHVAGVPGGIVAPLALRPTRQEPR